MPLFHIFFIMLTGIVSSIQSMDDSNPLMKSPLCWQMIKALHITQNTESALCRTLDSLNKTIRYDYYLPKKSVGPAAVYCKLKEVYKRCDSEEHYYVSVAYHRVQELLNSPKVDNSEELEIDAALRVWKDISSSIKEQSHLMQPYTAVSSRDKYRVIGLIFTNHLMQELYAHNDKAKREMQYQEGFFSTPPLLETAYQQYLFYSKLFTQPQNSFCVADIHELPQLIHTMPEMSRIARASRFALCTHLHGLNRSIYYAHCNAQETQQNIPILGAAPLYVKLRKYYCQIFEKEDSEEYICLDRIAASIPADYVRTALEIDAALDLWKRTNSYIENPSIQKNKYQLVGHIAFNHLLQILYADAYTDKEEMHYPPSFFTSSPELATAHQRYLWYVRKCDPSYLYHPAWPTIINVSE